MKKLLFFLSILWFINVTLHAQTTVITIGSGTTSQVGPVANSYGYERTASIYTPSDGLIAGGIVSLAWNRSAGTQYDIPVKIYLKEIPLANSQLDTTTLLVWSNLIYGATLVYSGTITCPASNGWVTTPLQIPFNYGGTGNLMVLVACDGGSSGKTVNWYYSAAGNNNNAYVRQNNYIDDNVSFADQYSWPQVGRNSNRPNIQLTIGSAITCPAIASLSVSSASSTTADINWIPIGNESQWIVCYKLQTASTWTEEIANSSAHTLSNLTPNTTYDLKVKAKCSATDTSYSSYSIAFKTDCSPMALPFFENFDNATVGGYYAPNAPACWSFVMDNLSGYAFVYSSSTNSNSPPNVYYLKNGNTVKGGEKEGLISPPFSESINTVRARFMARAAWASTPMPKLAVGYLTDPHNSNSFVSIDSVTLTVAHTQYIIPFNSVTSIPQKAAVVIMHGQTASNQSIYLDDVNIELIPNCADVFDLKVIYSAHDSIAVQYTSMASQFNILYKKTTDVNWQTLAVSGAVGGIGGLDPNTTYEFKAQSNCGNNQLGIFTSVIKSSTTCAPVALPLFENFDNTPTGAYNNPNAPTCWSYVKDYSSAYTYVYSSDNNSSPNCYLLSNTSSTQTQKTALISSQFSNSVRDVRTRFFSKASANGVILNVGYLTNPADLSTFRLHKAIQLTNAWAEYIVSFDTASFTGKYLVFLHGNTATSQSIYLDDIFIEKIPNCPDIDRANIKIRNIAGTTAVISCDEVENATAYDIRFKIKGTTNWTTVSGVVLPDTLSGLISGKYYDLSMKSNCGNNAGAWTYSINFWTAFDIPLSQNFDGTTIDNWTQMRNNVIGSVSATTTSGEYVSPAKGIAMSNGNCSSSDVLYYASPKINPAFPMPVLQVRFKARTNTFGQNLSVGVMNTDSLNSFTLIETIPLTTEWNTYVVDFTEYLGENANIAFGHNKNTPSTKIFLDDVYIDSITACQKVSNIFTNVYDNKIEIRWKDMQAPMGYTIEFTETRSSYTQSSTSMTNSYTILGLSSLENYTFRIKANCSSGIWSDTFKVTTTNTPESIPFTEYFEGYVSDWRLINGTQTNAWFIDSASANGGTKGLYISDTNGIVNRYKLTTSSQVYAAKSILFDEISDYSIKYDWQNMGEISDNLKVFLIPSNIPFVTAGSTFTESYGINLYGSTALYNKNTWQTKEVSFRISQPGVYYLVFYWRNDANSGSQPPASVDNIEISKLECAPPDDLEITETTGYEATIQYNLSLNAEGVRFIYKPATVNNWDTIYVASNNNSYTLENLQPATTYQIKAITYCGLSYESYSTPIYTFSTKCVPALTPWNETFDSSATFPPNSCWERKQLLCTPYIIMHNSEMSSVATHWIQGEINGSKTASINMANVDKRDWLITPQIELGQADENWALGFDVKLSSTANGNGSPGRGSDDKFIVLVSFDGGETWDPTDATVWSSEPTANYPYSGLNENYQTFHIPLNRMQTTIRAAFYAESTVINANDFLNIDNICVANASCLKPAILRVDSYSDTSINLKWSSSGESFTVFYREIDGNTAWRSENTSDTTYTLGILNRLNNGYTYEIYVKNNCPENPNTSSLPVEFLFPCAPQTLPWREGFENITASNRLPLCMGATSLGTHVVTEMSAQINYNRAARSGNKFASFVKSSNDYIFTPKFNLQSGGTYKFSFYYRTDEYDGWEKLEAKVCSNQNIQDTLATIGAPLTNIINGDYRQYMGYYTPSQSGTYCFAIRCKANTTPYYLSIDDLSVEISPCFGVTDLRNTGFASPTSVNLTWNSTGTGNFDIFYRDTAASANWIAGPQASNVSATLQGLAPDTWYFVKVRSNCGNGNVGDWTDSILIKTPCAYTFPIVETFDNMTAGSNNTPNAPACWSFVKDNSTASTFVYDGNSYSNPNCYYLYNGNSSPTEKTALISPYFSEPINSMRVRFMAKGASINSVLIVGYLTNSSDISTFELQDSVKLTTAWREYKVLFNTATTNGDVIVFLHGQNAAFENIFIDDIFIEPIPICGDITGLSTYARISPVIKVKWNAVPSTTGYDIQYKPATGATWNNMPSTTADSCIISGLQSGTDYLIRVRSKCNAVDTGAWIYVQANTACASENLPFAENFEGEAFPPSCWDRKEGLLNLSGGIVILNNPVIATERETWQRKPFANDVSNPSSGTALNIFGNTQINDWLISPPIDLGATGNALLEFDLALVGHNVSTPSTGDCSDDKFMVLVSRDGNWSINDTVAVWDNQGASRSFNNISHNVTGERISIRLRGVPGNARIAFYGVSTIDGNGDNDLFIDNISVKIPYCPIVENLSVSNAGTNATANWDASGQTQWEVVWKEGNSIIASHTVNVNSDVVSGLTRGNHYTVSVRNICSEYDASSPVIKTFTIGRCDTVKNISLETCASSVIVNWSAAAGQNKWQLAYVPLSGGNTSYKEATQIPDTITGLDPETTYLLRIRPICNVGDTGDFNNPKLFTTVRCQALSVIEAPYNTARDSVFVSWNHNPCHKNWELTIVPVDTDPDAGTIKEESAPDGIWEKIPNPYIPQYVCVRGICDDGSRGDWIKKLILDAGVLFAEKSSAKIILSPNPARDYTTISIEGASGEIEMVLMTPEGKILRKEKFNCRPTVNKDIALQGLAKGTYLLHFTHKNWTKVEKLIVQ